MNRKIAAILAADVAGYSTLVAEDEEEALRRLKAYRAVIDDFIVQFGGRIFNTAGDSVMAAFPSAVDAVRCSIDIQESLRTRNRAYPESRHMQFRIGINIGDVVERDGDLLGDGVNLAARLQTLAPPGGVCVSRSVHEQVIGKLSVAFDDLGAHTVKNIPTPVHVYGIAWKKEAGPRATLARASLLAKPAVRAGAVVAACAIVAGLGYAMLRRPASHVAAAPAPNAIGASIPSEPPAQRSLVPEAVPFLANRYRQELADIYLPATGFKALAINQTRFGYIVGAADESAARTVAMERCEQRSRGTQYVGRCELYAVGDQVVWPHAVPPVPPQPWLTRDAAIEQPLTLDIIRRLRVNLPQGMFDRYAAHKAFKAIALYPRGATTALESYQAEATGEDAVRGALEMCGHRVKDGCLILAYGDTVVVPLPATMAITGLFRVATHPQIKPELRTPLERRLAASPGRWSAVAVGTGNRPGVALSQDSEEHAVATALAECARRDRDCAVVAIGPFTVAPLTADDASRMAREPVPGAGSGPGIGSKEVSKPAPSPKATP